MHKTRARIGALVVALGVALAFVLCGVVARADENEGYEFTLTVQGTDNKEAAVAADLEKAGVKVNVYKMADARYGTDEGGDGYDTYEYVNWDKYAFADLKGTFDKLAANRQTTAEQWKTLYDSAAEIVATASPKPEAAATGAFGDGMKLNSKGLYLVIAQGPEGEFDAKSGYAGVAYGEKLKFTFPATMVAAPTKAEQEVELDDGTTANIAYTDSENGEWLHEASIVLKSSYAPLYGDLIINKDVEGYKGEETTFVFHIYDSQTGGEVYENYAAITLEGEGNSKGSAKVTHIPAGIEVTVDEDYTGGRYTLKSANGQTATIKFDPDAGDEDLPSVSFTNEPGGTPDGHGIENHFDLVKDETPEGGHYEAPVATPDSPYKPDQAQN